MTLHFNLFVVQKRLSTFSKIYVRPILQRDYVVLRTEDRLMMIENEENFKRVIPTDYYREM